MIDSSPSASVLEAVERLHAKRDADRARQRERAASDRRKSEKAAIACGNRFSTVFPEFEAAFEKMAEIGMPEFVFSKNVSQFGVTLLVRPASGISDHRTPRIKFSWPGDLWDGEKRQDAMRVDVVTAHGGNAVISHFQRDQSGQVRWFAADQQEKAICGLGAWVEEVLEVTPTNVSSPSA